MGVGGGMSSDQSILLLIMGGSVIFFLLFGMFGIELVAGDARRTRKRVEGLRNRWRPDASAAAQRMAVKASSVKRDTNYSANPLIDRVLRQAIPRPDRLRARLQQTGKDITLGVYAIINVLMLIAAGGGAHFWIGLSPILSAMVGLTIGVGLPHFMIGRMIAKRQKKFLGQFPESLDLIVRGLKSGLPVTETMGMVAREMPDPVGTEFRRVADEVQLGQTMEQALWEAAQRIAVQEMKFFIIALSIQRETGGNLAETLENLSDILRRRRQMKMKIRAMSSEARASAMIIGAMPFIVSGILYLVNRDYVMMLVTDPRGVVLASVGLTLMAVGGGVMAKMIRFDV